MTTRRVSWIISANIENWQKNLQKAETKMQRFSRSMERIGSGLTRNLTAPLAAIGGVAIKTSADYEKLRQSMDILNGSAEEGARNFERLKRFSAQTPFQLQDLARAQNMLQGFGLSADQAFQSLTMIGDISAVTGGSINDIGIAFGQAAAEGRLMTRDIRQLINQGVPAIKLLANTMGVAESEVLSLAEQGEISFDILQRSFREATSEGGMFADGMKKQSNTLHGVFSTLKDNVSIALGELGTSIAETLDLNNVVRKVTVGTQLITKNFKEMSQESRERILRVAGLLVASGPLALAIAQMSKIVVAFSTLVRTSFFKMAAPIIGFGLLLQKQADILAKYDPSLAAVIVGLKGEFKGAMLDTVNAMGKWLSEATGMDEALKGLNDLLEEGDANLEEFSKSADAFQSPTPQAVTQRVNIERGGGVAGQMLVDPQIASQFANQMLRIRSLVSYIPEDFSAMGNSGTKALEAITGVANTFTDSFGRGMANVIVQGERLVDTLENIGKLLLSSAIQKGISLLLTGGLSGGGFFGSGGGLFGRLFGVSDAIISPKGDIITTHPDDYLIATKNPGSLGGGLTKKDMMDVMNSVSWKIQGSDIYAAGQRGGETYNR